MERRPLRYATFDDLLADAHQLATHGYDRVGNWSLGQIAYHDRFGRLTGFCFTPGPDGPTTALREGQDDDLNLVYWEKDGLRYVLVGWTDANKLTDLAAGLRATYGEDT